MSPELRDDLEIALGQLDRLRARGDDGATAFQVAMNTFRVLRSSRKGDANGAGDEIVASVAAHHGVPVKRLIAHGRNNWDPVSKIRDEAAWLMRRAELSYPAIGLSLNRDHTSMIAAVRRFEKRLAQDELLRARMEKAQESAA